MAVRAQDELSSTRSNQSSLTKNDRERAYPPIKMPQTSLGSSLFYTQSDQSVTAFQMPICPVLETGELTLSTQSQCESMDRDHLPTDNDYDSSSDCESEPEPSPAPSLTPIISDLDDLLSDSPMPILSPLTQCTAHSMSDGEVSDTPEPGDTPWTLDHSPSPHSDAKPQPDGDDLDSLCSDSDFDFDADDVPTLSINVSDSITERTMTRINPHRHQTIKSFTPITESMAKRRIHSHFTRRRSVQNVSDSMHRLIALDSDLERIRTEFKQKRTSNEVIDEVEEQDIWNRVGTLSGGGLVMLSEEEEEEEGSRSESEEMIPHSVDPKKEECTQSLHGDESHEEPIAITTVPRAVGVEWSKVMIGVATCSVIAAVYFKFRKSEQKSAR